MNQTMTNFFSEFAAAAQAMERLPQVEQELEQERGLGVEQARVIASHEQRIIELKEEINALHNAVRDAEGRADKAETMFLEADDRTLTYQRLVNNFVLDASALVRAIEPPQTVPTPLAVESTEQVSGGVSSGQSDTRPTDTIASATGDGNSSLADIATVSSVPAIAQPEPAVSVQPDPTLSSIGQTLAQTGSESSEQTSAISSVTADATSATDNYSTRFANKLYMNVPGHYTLQEWQDGGGSEIGYHWRFGNPIPAGHTETSYYGNQA